MHAKLSNSLTTMNGRAANWKSERTVSLDHPVGSPGAVVDSLVLAVASVVDLEVVAVDLEVVEALEVVTVEDAEVSVAAATMAQRPQE